MKFLLKESYLKTIENSISSKLFRNLYFKVENKKTDILKDGDDIMFFDCRNKIQ